MDAISKIFILLGSVVLNGEFPVTFGLQSPKPFNLESMNISKSTVTVSGFSAGSSMATQFHIAHSSKLVGAGLFGQVFYRCGPTSLIEFGIRCSKMGHHFIPYDVKQSIQDAMTYNSLGLIDNLESLKNQKVFIWIGNQDEYIPLDLAIQNRDFYSPFLENPENQIHLKVENAKHLFPTATYGLHCNESAEKNFYLGNCNYSGAGQLLQFLLSDETVALPTENEETPAFSLSNVKIFNQEEFYNGVRSIESIGMGKQGYIYIPEKCLDKTQKCHLHLNFHGCNEWPLDVANEYIVNSGFLPVAEKNGIIVVFPLTTSIPTNMNGCWDFFGYTGPHFATNEGEQIKVVYGILKRLIDE